MKTKSQIIREFCKKKHIKLIDVKLTKINRRKIADIDFKALLSLSVASC